MVRNLGCATEVEMLSSMVRILTTGWLASRSWMAPRSEFVRVSGSFFVRRTSERE